MIIIPSIDLKNGRVVRLSQGRPLKEVIYPYDPVEAAMMWEEKGAERLHVVDLDGAFAGEPKNLELVKRIATRVRIPIQFGGGLRKMRTIERVIGYGVRWVILGTALLRYPHLVKDAVMEFEERIIIGIDAKEGKVCVRGWEEETSIEPLVLARDMERLGVGCIIYTDILRDGMMSGPNFDGVSRIVEALQVKVIASGGISSIEDIKRLKLLEEKGLFGVIIGKALYEGTIDLAEAIRIGRGEGDERDQV
jgi:phosphoribosylformimino-5-aminoimidazole carboxamide ribotide isomerase